MKRIFDLLLTIPGIFVLSPLLLILMAIVRIKHGSPVFFTQIRPGQNGKPFCMFKLRTMANAKDVYGNLLPDNIRLTGFGRFLRSTSLDELPTLFNVLKGDMSLVGPRPLLMEYLPLYTPAQNRRHEVKPGITGWAQVNGRNAISWEQKFKYDVWYLDNHSLWLDIRVILMTMRNVILREGINHNATETMPFFRGKKINSGK